MPRFAANLSMLFTEVPLLARFERAARAGFRAVEFQFPYAEPAAAIRSALDASGLENVLFNLPPGSWDAGERGLGAQPGREREFLAGVDTALGYAAALGTRRLHAMAGLVVAGVDRTAMRRTYVANLRAAARRVAPDGITLLIEPINPRDIPGYFLNTQEDAHAVVAEVGEPNLKVQMDLYHCQIVEGDLAKRIRHHLPGVGHIQIAGVPGRHEPDVGEINYPYLFALLDELGYEGWIGCEYRPRGLTEDGLGWAAPYLRKDARE
jgi:hydroxypyruvate isomerase